MHRRFLTAALCLLLTASARSASAQSIQQWIDRGYANLNVAFESGSGSLNDAATFRIYDDTGTKTVQASQDSGSLFDFSLGGRVWRNASVGLGFHRGSTSSDAAIIAVVPSPVAFSLPARTGTANVPELDRSERAVHLQFGYMIPINEKIDVHVTAGPSFFHLSQDVVSEVTVAEAGAPFTAVNATAVVTERSKSATGGHIGADVSYKLLDSGSVATGAGLFVRYSGASAKVQVLQNEVESNVGGLLIGFGVRVRF